VFFNCVAIILYLLTAAVYAFAHFKENRFFISINFLLIFATCFNNYMSMPFNPGRPREFVYWSTILIFRCSFIVSMFGLNGMWDVIASILIPAGAIFAQSLNINDADSSEHIAVPIFATLIGVALFNYILGLDQRKLFLLEKYREKIQNEQNDIIDLLPGSVVVMDVETE